MNPVGRREQAKTAGAQPVRTTRAPLSADEMLDIIQVLPDVVFRCEKHADGKIYWSFNEGRLAEEFHVTTEEIRGRSLEELFPGGASDEMKEHFEAAFRGEPTEFVNEISGRFFRHFPQPVFDEDGNVVHVVGFITEVTTLTRAQIEIQKLTEELAKRLIDISEANQDLEAFNYTLSHDLRSPLSVVETQCKLIEMAATKGDTSKVIERANMIRRSARRMSGLIESVLALSRASRGELEKQQVDLSAMAIQILDELQESDAGRVVETNVASQVSAFADAKMVHQVLSNLLGNAWKYTGKETTPSITFGERMERGEPIYFVKDNGAGFDMAHAGRLFEPFKRLHSTSDFDGTGVGLATVRKIVERHGGRIWATSRPGEGATFYFTLEGRQDRR